MKPEQLDLRTAITQPAPVRCRVNESELYEIRFQVLAQREAGGRAIEMRVFRSVNAGNTWQPIRFRRNWRKSWWAIFWRGLGGGNWPPEWEDYMSASVKAGKLSIMYCNLWESGSEGQAFIWEMQYDSTMDCWDLAMIKEIWPGDNALDYATVRNIGDKG